jgi:hypothetical protein
MSASETTGGCPCGALRFTAHGAPLRAGLCHCMTCRKAHASAFNPFVVFSDKDVVVTGALESWRSSPEYERLLCPGCGSRVLGRTPGSGEVEVALGSFDNSGLVAPEYECWIGTRERWLKALDVPQYDQNRF